MALPAGHVVDLSWLAGFGRQPVGPDGIPDIGEVANRLQVADLDDRPANLFFDFRDLLAEVADHKHLAPPRAFVVERPHANGTDVVGLPVLVSHVILGHLRDGIRR